jgi:hypothetical protein
MFLSLLDMSDKITYYTEDVELSLGDGTCMDTTCVHINGFGREFSVYFDYYDESII